MSLFACVIVGMAVNAKAKNAFVQNFIPEKIRHVNKNFAGECILLRYTELRVDSNANRYLLSSRCSLN